MGESWIILGPEFVYGDSGDYVGFVLSEDNQRNQRLNRKVLKRWGVSFRQLILNIVLYFPKFYYWKVKNMNNTIVNNITPFIPAKDHKLSLRFYKKSRFH